MLGKKEKKIEQPEIAIQNQVSQTANWMGTIFLAAAASFFILVGLIMLFVEGIQPLYLTYLMSTLLIVFGIGMIVRYFVTEAYRSMHDYSFSGGALIVILGGCTLARKAEITAQLGTFIGLLVLAVAVVMLQQAMQLHFMQNRMWPVVLVLSLFTIMTSVVLLFDLKVLTERANKLEYWILLIAGIFTLVSMVISAVGVQMYRISEKKAIERMKKENVEKTYENKSVDENVCSSESGNTSDSSTKRNDGNNDTDQAGDLSGRI